MSKTSKNALVLLARNPTGARTGRIAVLESAVKALQEEGVHVHVLAITSTGDETTWLGAPVQRIKPVPVAGMATAAAKSLVTGRTLNEAVFDSKRVIEQVKAIADAVAADVVVADGLRVFAAAQATGRPVITHLDDLLSSRYSSADFVDGNSSVLGYFGSELPGPVRGVAEKAAGALMGLESKRAYRSEIKVAQHSAVTAMTSNEEAKELSERSGAPVAFLPMGVEIARDVDAASAPADTAVFVGALHYGPNISALRFLRDEVLPELQKRGRSVRIDVVGLIGDNDISEFDGTALNFTDYAPDLVEALAGHRMLLSPITAGTGVKTKALDGMSVSLPVVATTMGMAGIPAVNGESALIADTAAQYAEAMISLMDVPELATRIGAGGRRILETSMTNSSVHAGWVKAFETAMGRATR